MYFYHRLFSCRIFHFSKSVRRNACTCVTWSIMWCSMPASDSSHNKKVSYLYPLPCTLTFSSCTHSACLQFACGDRSETGHRLLCVCVCVWVGKDGLIVGIKERGEMGQLLQEMRSRYVHECGCGGKGLVGHYFLPPGFLLFFYAPIKSPTAPPPTSLALPKASFFLSLSELGR